MKYDYRKNQRKIFRISIEETLEDECAHTHNAKIQNSKQQTKPTTIIITMAMRLRRSYNSLGVPVHWTDSIINNLMTSCAHSSRLVRQHINKAAQWRTSIATESYWIAVVCQTKQAHNTLMREYRLSNAPAV